MFAGELVPAVTKPLFGFIVKILHSRLGGMIKKRVANKISGLRIVTGDEHNWQAPARSCLVAGFRNAGLVSKSPCRSIPAAQVLVESLFRFSGQVRQHGRDPNLFRIPIGVEVPTTVEIVLVNNRPPTQTLWSEYQI